MSKIKISTDSTSDIPQSFRESLNISVLPLTILAEGREYRDGVDITPTEFYKILDAATELPVSSQVRATEYLALYRQVWEDGYTDLIHVSINSKGSGTYQAAVMSRDMFLEEHPEAKLNIHIIDSCTYSMAYGMAVVEAAQMAQAGASVEEILAHIQDWVENTRPMFVPLNLKCVKKSGRISPAAAFVGDAIGLKPLITFEDGEAKILSKVRGEHKAISALVDICRKERRPGTSYCLVHGSNLEAFAALKDACAQVMEQPPMAEYPVGCIIGINTGPDMIGILYRR
ncbi:MAG: DegV family protein [Candidatus Faecousia sp.]|nr:DegV family protein [Candidatus Faecousia sp.]